MKTVKVMDHIFLSQMKKVSFYINVISQYSNFIRYLYLFNSIQFTGNFYFPMHIYQRAELKNVLKKVHMYTYTLL